jgi:hypothetical protein
MKTTFLILFTVFCIIYSSKPTIAFKPFSIEFGSPYTPFGIVFLILALSCFNLQSRKDGKLEALEKYYRIGFKEGSEFTVEQINDKLREQGKDAQISIKRDVD